MSVSHLLVAVAVVAAFVLNILALQDRSASTLVVVADGPVAAGSVLNTESVRLVPVDSSFTALGTLVTENDLSGYLGWVVQRAVPDGGLIDRASLVEPGAPAGKRSMSIPLEQSRAAGGSIAAGDLVDVISVVEGEAMYVVAGVEVVVVPSGGQAAFGVLDYHIVVAVDERQALALAEAMDRGRIDVVRSTGAPSVGALSDEASP